MVVYRKTVAGMIYQDQDFLLLKKPHWNWWDILQEGVEEDESLESALLRGFEEELRVTQFDAPISTDILQRRNFSKETFAHYRNKKEGLFTGKEIYYFVAKYLGNRNDIVLGDDLSDKKWCREKELLESIYQPSISEVKNIFVFMKQRGLII